MEAGGQSCWRGSSEWKLGDNHVGVEVVNGRWGQSCSCGSGEWKLGDNHVGVEVVNGSWGTIMFVWKW